MAYLLVYPDPDQIVDQVPEVGILKARFYRAFDFPTSHHMSTPG